MKRDLYEGGVKTPFIVHWPGVIQPGSKSEQNFAFWDLLPTFAELTGTEKPADTDGISFLPVLLGKEQKEKHEYLYWEFFEQGGKQAILKGKWKAVRLNVRDPGKEMVFELYDLVSDPAERKNIAAEHPQKISEFENLFYTAREEFEVTPLFRNKNERPKDDF